MITYTNRSIPDITKFKADDACLEDIAVSLSLINRWCGHLGVGFSVAQHCLSLASYMIQGVVSGFNPEDEEFIDFLRILLLHDASEAYLSDISFGVKDSLPCYKDLEAHVQGVIYQKYLGRQPTGSELTYLHLLDHRLAVAEYLQLKPGAKQEDLGLPHRDLEPLEMNLCVRDPEMVQSEFLHTAAMLGLKDGKPRPRESADFAGDPRHTYWIEGPLGLRSALSSNGIKVLGQSSVEQGRRRWVVSPLSEENMQTLSSWIEDGYDFACGVEFFVL